MLFGAAVLFPPQFNFVLFRFFVVVLSFFSLTFIHIFFVTDKWLCSALINFVFTATPRYAISVNLLYSVAEATGVEVRAKYAQFQKRRQYGDHKGLRSIIHIKQGGRGPGRGVDFN